nr:MAG TPA: hypothetical protein [Caudoviricetes sp.]
MQRHESVLFFYPKISYRSVASRKGEIKHDDF